MVDGGLNTKHGDGRRYRGLASAKPRLPSSVALPLRHAVRRPRSEVCSNCCTCTPPTEALHVLSIHHALRQYHRTTTENQMGGGRGSSVSRASDRHAADAGSIPQCGEGIFLPESTFSADSLTVSGHPRVQSHAFTSVRTLKILQSVSEFGGL